MTGSGEGRMVAVTGAGGFIGSYLARRLVAEGYRVRCIDNFIRGRSSRLSALGEKAEQVVADVRDTGQLVAAFQGCEAVFHLAAVNGTDNFYKHPELVLDVGVRGMLAVSEACRAADVADVVVASSAEVYQSPSVVPTDESAPLSIPDPLNPRYSYAGSKLISELIAFNYCRDMAGKVQVFRPHNVYGPDMGWKHVVPQLIQKIDAAGTGRHRTIEIQGDGSETRAFCYVDDIVDGIIGMWTRGETMNLYHIGSMEEVSIADLARRIAAAMDVEVELVASPSPLGGTRRRCPDIGKMRALGYEPAIPLTEGLRRTVDWYLANSASDENALL